MKTFGKVLREKREQKGWTQKQLAEKLNTHSNCIINYEREKVYPSYLVVIDFADLFGCTMDEMVGREPPKKGDRIDDGKRTEKH